MQRIKSRLAVACASVAVLAGVFTGVAAANVADGVGITAAHTTACHDFGLSVNFCGIQYVGSAPLGTTKRRYTFYKPSTTCAQYAWIDVNASGTVVGNTVSFCQ